MGSKKKTKLDYGLLLERAKEGEPLPSKVLGEIRTQLRTESFDEDPYTLIHILGKAMDVQSADLIRHYTDFGDMESEDDALVRRLSIQVLGEMWQLPQAFALVAEKLVTDPSPYVKAVCATSLGTLGAKFETLRPEAARLLLGGLDRRDPEEPEIWESHYLGLLELLHIPVDQWPSAHGFTEDELDFEILRRARSLVK